MNVETQSNLTSWNSTDSFFHKNEGFQTKEYLQKIPILEKLWESFCYLINKKGEKIEGKNNANKC